jgi:hypothetical protein
MLGQHEFLTGFCGEQNVFIIGAWTGALGVTCGWCSSFEKSIYDRFSRDVGCCSVSLILMNMGRKYCCSSGIRVDRGSYCANSRLNIYSLNQRYTSLNSPMLIPARPQCTSLTFSYYLHLLQYSKGKGLPQLAEVAQGVPGRLRPRNFLTFGTTRVVGRQPYPRRNPWYLFLEGESTPRHMVPSVATEKIPSD